jgi:hypothetical protein
MDKIRIDAGRKAKKQGMTLKVQEERSIESSILYSSPSRGWKI